MTTNEFPKRLQRLRERNRSDRKKLAELCGLSKNTIARYERGERVPKLDDAAAIADFFGVSLDSLCGRKKIFLSEPQMGDGLEKSVLH